MVRSSTLRSPFQLQPDVALCWAPGELRTSVKSIQWQRRWNKRPVVVVVFLSCVFFVRSFVCSSTTRCFLRFLRRFVRLSHEPGTEQMEPTLIFIIFVLFFCSQTVCVCLVSWTTVRDSREITLIATGRRSVRSSVQVPSAEG